MKEKYKPRSIVSMTYHSDEKTVKDVTGVVPRFRSATKTKISITGLIKSIYFTRLTILNETIDSVFPLEMSLEIFYNNIEIFCLREADFRRCKLIKENDGGERRSTYKLRSWIVSSLPENLEVTFEISGIDLHINYLDKY